MNRTGLNHPKCLAIVLLALGSATGPAAAIDIILDFNKDASEQYFDNGQNLTDQIHPIFQAAEARWEAIIEDVHTVKIHYWWADVPSSLMQPLDYDGFGRIIEANVKISTQFSYFLDPSPLADTEFTMRPYLFRDTPPAEQDEAFRNPNTVPDVFEVSYVGEEVNNLAPDLLTVVMHEVGHTLGVFTVTASPECDDNYFDIPPGFVNGAQVGLKVYELPNGDLSCGHLALGGTEECLNCQSLFWPGFNTDARTLPGAADILASAAASGWTDVNLPRKYFLEVVGDWSEDGKWLGGRQPDLNTDAYIVSDPPSACILNLFDGVARNLTVKGDNDIFMGGFQLIVIEKCLLQGNGATINMNSFNSELLVTNLFIKDGAQLNASVGLVEAEEIHNRGIIQGAAVINILNELENRGTIRGSNGTLIFTTANAGDVFDLDGHTEEPGALIDATSGSVLFFGNFSDGYLGSMVVGDGQAIGFTDQLALFGPLQLNGGGTQATVNGPMKFHFGSSIEVDQTGQLLGSVVFLPAAEVTVPDEDDVLILAGPTTFRGGSYTGLGDIRQVGNAVVSLNTTIGPVSTYDWDGDGDTVTSVHADVTFTIDADSIETGLDGYDGLLILVGSTVVVNTPQPWALCGQALLNVFGMDNATIAGATVQNLGLIRVANTGHLSAQVNTFEGAEIRTNDAGSTVVMSSAQANLLVGGQITGLGTLNVADTSRLHGYGLIETQLDIDGETRAEDGVLTVSGSIVDLGVIGTASPTGELFVTHDWSTLNGRLDLDDGTVSGGNILNSGTTTGFGEVDVVLFSNRGLVAPGGEIGAPGSAPGVLLMNDQYEQLSSGELQIGIGGLIPGQEHDKVLVRHQATLAGELDIDLILNFAPNLGDEFVIMTHETRVGEFDVVYGTNIGGGLKFDVQYNPLDLRLVVVVNDCPADFDASGGVDVFDLLNLLGSWGPCDQPCPPFCLQDINGDCVVGVPDLLDLLADWGVCP